MLFNHVAIESVEAYLPPRRVTSEYLEDQIAETTTRLHIRGSRASIEHLSGIGERRFWEPGTLPSDVATVAARKAIEKAAIDPAEIGCLINTSISKDYIEPSVASLVHGNLGLSPHCVNYDVSNACLGFLNGMASVAMMIEAGIIQYGLVVCAETFNRGVNATIRLLQSPETTIQDFRDNFATLTLGCGAVAMVLSHADVSRTTHRLNGGVTLAATEHNRLCVATDDYMTADPGELLTAGVTLAHAAWQLATETLPHWNDDEIALYVPHQVGSRHTAALAETLGLTFGKLHLNFETLGNIGAAALPITLAMAAESGHARQGDHLGLMGVGSGLNSSMMSVTW